MDMQEKSVRWLRLTGLDLYFLICLVICLLVIVAVLCIALFVPPPGRILQRWDGAEVQRWGQVDGEFTACPAG